LGDGAAGPPADTSAGAAVLLAGAELAVDFAGAAFRGLGAAGRAAAFDRSAAGFRAVVAAFLTGVVFLPEPLSERRGRDFGA
jgi:hypothetical protein